MIRVPVLILNAGTCRKVRQRPAPGARTVGGTGPNAASVGLERTRMRAPHAPDPGQAGRPPGCMSSMNSPLLRSNRRHPCALQSLPSTSAGSPNVPTSKPTEVTGSSSGRLKSILTSSSKTPWRGSDQSTPCRTLEMSARTSSAVPMASGTKSDGQSRPSGPGPLMIIRSLFILDRHNARLSPKPH